jgi:hypothetical protein
MTTAVQGAAGYGGCGQTGAARAPDGASRFDVSDLWFLHFFEVSTSRNSTSIILLDTEVLNYPDLMSSLFEIFLRMICFANWRLKFHGLSRVQHPSACLGQKCRRFLGLKSDHLVMKKQNL